MQNTLEIVLTLHDEISNNLKAMSKNFQKAGEDLQKVGSEMVKIGAAPTAALLLATKAAIDYESAFAGIRKTVDASEAEFAKLSQNIRDIAKTTPISASELARMGELAGQLGVRGAENLTKFIDTVAKIGVTTNLTGEEASTAFARIANIMQEPIKNVDRMGSVVVDLGNNFATTENEIVMFANRIAGAGKIAGLTTANIFSIGTAMSSVGVEAEAGGTAVQKVLLSMNEAVVMNNKDLKVFAQTAGMTIDEFKKADSIKQFEQFVLGLGKSGDKAIGILSDLGLEDQRLIRSFLSLANAGDLVSRSIDKGNKGWESNTALSTEANKRFATTASQLKILQNNLVDVGITLGSVILPALNSLITSIRPAIESFSRFAEENKLLIVGILALGSAIGVLGSVIYVFGMLQSAVSIIFASLIPGIITIGTIFGSLGSALAAISLPIWITIAAVAALIAIGVLLWQNWDFVYMKAIEIWTAITSFLSMLPDTIGGFFIDLFINRIPYAVGYAVGWLSVVIPQIVSNIITWFSELPGKVLAIFELVRSSIVTKLQAVWTWISTEVPTWPGKIYDYIKSIPTKVKGVFEDAKTWAINKMNDLYDEVFKIWAKIEGIFKGIIDAAGKAWDAATKGFQAGKGAGLEIKHDGGWIDSTKPYLMQQGEYVLSKDMLAGRQSVDSRVMNSNNQTVQISAVINNPMDIDKMLDDLSWRLNYAYS